MVLVLTMVVLQSISFSNYALTTKTTNIIYGSAPYLTFDGGRTRVTNTAALLGISLSDGRTFTPTTNNSVRNPIELPVAGQSFADIGMLVPTDTNSIELSSLIGTPYNYWGDDDGDGQGVNGITATGRLYLSIADKDNNPVARNEVLNICKAPYKLTLSNGEGRLTTRYGVPNESRFSAGNATYYINPNKETPAICFAKPNLGNIGPSAAVYDREKGFLIQSVTPSSYGLNFPTTGANNLYFDLDIVGNNQALSWEAVSHGGITATMTDSTSTSVRVTLTGPVATPSQWQSQYGGRFDKPSLPQTFELVGRDSSGNAVVKYGFVLKQWFVNRGTYNKNNYNDIRFWCPSGYRLPAVKDLTLGTCTYEGACVPGLPPNNGNHFLRNIGGGLIAEWGGIPNYTGANFIYSGYWTKDRVNNSIGDNARIFLVIMSRTQWGRIIYSNWDRATFAGLCVYP
ncbi:hypothetical protein [Gilliamella sp. W8129]|uniref:hypothetical protein n=2 Tax=unclassified Gilliamella TaxID=2685620 RepID=UPI0018EF91EB|nr:hypothetical protein [Gilliamella sp. W8129]